MPTQLLITLKCVGTGTALKLIVTQMRPATWACNNCCPLLLVLFVTLAAEEERKRFLFLATLYLRRNINMKIAASVRCMTA